MSLQLQKIISYLLCTSLLLSGGCASVGDIRPLTEQPDALLDNKYSEQEQELVKKSNEMHADFVKDGLILQDPQLQNYINAIGNKLIPPTAASRIKFNFYIMRTPIVNAFALPNGNVYLTVGLLARLSNEAEVAQVMGHEIAHVVLRHGLIRKEQQETSLVAAHIADLLLMGTQIAYLPYITSMASYSREQESEADRSGVEYMHTAGYRLDNTDKLFKTIQEVKTAEAANNSIYSSHPDNDKRASDMKTFIMNQYAGTVSQGVVGQDTFAQFRKDILLQDIKLKLNKNLFELAKDASDVGVKLYPNIPDFYYLSGECERLMADRPDEAAKEYAWLYDVTYNDELKKKFNDKVVEHEDKAKSLYNKIISTYPAFADSYKGLGLLLYANNKKEEAKVYFNQYLKLSSSTVKDRKYIEGLAR